MKKLLNTFFFGYLELKWRRLVRTLLIIPFILLMILLFWNHLQHGDMSLAIPFAIFMVVCLVSLLSWLVKPFAVKED